MSVRRRARLFLQVYCRNWHEIGIFYKDRYKSVVRYLVSRGCTDFSSYNCFAGLLLFCNLATQLYEQEISAATWRK